MSAMLLTGRVCADMDPILITYLVMGELCSREEALRYWSAECARVGRCPEEVQMFEYAERDAGSAERKALKETADLQIILTFEEF